jgi:uncharacterized protein (TIGR01319 family)
MRAVLAIDFGSTYTKAAAVDVEGGEILGVAQSGTTALTDIGDGLDRAVEKLRAQIGGIEFAERYACSSAAGGLRMIASGLVPSLTAEAAKRAALGAGAKVVRTFSYELTRDDLAEITRLKPDILLLTGGTDGGNKDNILINARALASLPAAFPVVVAGNRAVRDECAHILRAAGCEAIPCENVMPTFNQLNIEPAQAVIRELFLKRIIAAKGLSKAQALIDGILMPTPSAVLAALELFAKDAGELVAVDLGGATTDIYSITDGLPTKAGTVMKGLPEPYAKRTVEGDIGMRFSARGVVEGVGLEALVASSGRTEAEVEAWLREIESAPGVLAQTEAQKAIDLALASLAIELGLVRHAGEIEQVYTPLGVAYQQTGKDLTRVKTIVLTGGALVHAEDPREIARRAMGGDHPMSLMPGDAVPVLDGRYILFAMGLLSQRYPELARSLLKKEFQHGNSQ